MLRPMTTRRSLLALPALLPGAAWAQEATRRGAAARFRPGAPPTRVEARVGTDRVIRLRGAGRGAPEGEVLLPTRYGGLQPLAAVRFGERDLVLARFDGNGGTGVSQTLGALIGADARNRLRVVGVESLELRETPGCEEESTLRARLLERSEPVLSWAFRRDRGPCAPPRLRGAAETWSDTLAWLGEGVVTAPAPPANAGPVRRRVAQARLALGRALLAQPVTDLRGSVVADSGIFDLLVPG